MSVHEHWTELLTVALLGTDRREPPDPPGGEVADLVADAMRADPARRLLADVAATTVLRRAAFMAGPPVDRLRPPVADPRPECPASAVVTWKYLVAEWPVLIDEWLATVVESGWRLPPDVAVHALRTSRADPDRRARSVRAAGPLARWLEDHVPELAASGTSGAAGRSGGPSTSGAGASEVPLSPLPQLAIPPDLVPLLRADPNAFLAVAVPEFDAGRVGAAHRAVWANVIARCRSDVLAPFVAALEAIDPSSPSSGIAHLLADLARTRHRMLTDLTP